MRSSTLLCLVYDNSTKMKGFSLGKIIPDDRIELKPRAMDFDYWISASITFSLGVVEGHVMINVQHAVFSHKHEGYPTDAPWTSFISFLLRLEIVFLFNSNFLISFFFIYNSSLPNNSTTKRICHYSKPIGRRPT